MTEIELKINFKTKRTVWFFVVRLFPEWIIKLIPTHVKILRVFINNKENQPIRLNEFIK